MLSLPPPSLSHALLIVRYPVNNPSISLILLPPPPIVPANLRPVLALNQREIEEGEQEFHGDLCGPDSGQTEMEFECERVLKGEVDEPLGCQIEPQRLFLEGKTLNCAIEHPFIKIGENIQLQ